MGVQCVYSLIRSAHVVMRSGRPACAKQASAGSSEMRRGVRKIDVLANRKWRGGISGHFRTGVQCSCGHWLLHFNENEMKACEGRKVDVFISHDRNGECVGAMK